MSRVPRIFAHRGGRKWAPENTLSAFAKSIKLGVYGVELDVHRCKSGELVVIHDQRLSITTDGQGIVSAFTFDELQKLNAGNATFGQEHIPLLTEVLELVAGQIVINIEVKNTPTAYPGIEDDLLKILSGYAHKDRIVISAFDHAVLKRISEKTSEYKLAMLIDGLIVGLGDYAKQVGATAWHPYFGDARADNVAEAHAAAIEVNVWTPNTAADWDAVIAMGVDGICTDDPEALLAHLQLKFPPEDEPAAIDAAADATSVEPLADAAGEPAAVVAPSDPAVAISAQKPQQ